MVLLNIDAGEHDDEPEELWALADILSVACGGHAGDDRSMARVANFCRRRKRPKLGAHPSYPDRKTFGRTSMVIESSSLATTIRSQCAALARVAGLPIGWVKPHGALYHDAAASMQIARALLDGVTDALGTVTVIGPQHGMLIGASISRHMPYLREGFADRATRPDGSLVPRSEPHALITDPAQAAARARELRSQVDTICIHSDTPNALAIARAVREVIDGG